MEMAGLQLLYAAVSSVLWLYVSLEAVGSDNTHNEINTKSSTAAELRTVTPGHDSTLKKVENVANAHGKKICAECLT